MVLMDGAVVARELKTKIAAEVTAMIERGEKRPCLVAVIVGDNPASRAYVRSKMKSCKETGFDSQLIELGEDTPQEELLSVIHSLNENATVDGYIVQLPLPAHIDEETINLAIDPRKDVDGFHPMNFGRMALGMDTYIPATPLGILKMLEHYDIDTKGKNCVVIGRSNIVGMPMSILMAMKRPYGNCTVTITHSASRDLKAEVQRADIVIAAIGKPHFVTADMVKEGAVVIDVGINRIDDPAAPKGTRIVGDVDFNGVSQKASYITPVPGGVGLMTVASLMFNTLKSARAEVYSK